MEKCGICSRGCNQDAGVGVTYQYIRLKEDSYQQSLRSLRNRLSALQNSSTVTIRHTTKAHNSTGPEPESLAYGGRLVRLFGVGQEVHFVRLVMSCWSPRPVLLASLKWSSQQPTCRVLNPCRPTHAILPLFVLPLHFILLHSSSRCTYNTGFSISGRDSNICTGQYGQILPERRKKSQPPKWSKTTGSPTSNVFHF